jgi:hypothetical protein
LGIEKQISGCDRSAPPSAVVPQRGAPTMKKIFASRTISRLHTVLISLSRQRCEGWLDPLGPHARRSPASLSA